MSSGSAARDARYDAIVVGAGLSGLVCATRLVAGGARVLVVEALDRVGGRLASGRVGGLTVDLGGQWMSVGQPRLAALAAEVGVPSYPQRRDGRPLIDLPRPWFAAWRAARKIRRLARTPDAAPDVSLAAWLAAHVGNPHARALVAMHAELVFATDVAALSLRYYLAILAATGDFAPRGPDLPGGGREHRFAGGAQLIAQRLAEQLGERVRLGTPIATIMQRDDDVAVGELVARRVVLAVPPHVARTLAVELAPDARAYVDAVQPGAVVKCFAVYARAFWRDAGLSGEVYCPAGDVRAVVPLEFPDDPPVALLAFVVGPVARAWPARDPAERRAAVLATLVAHLGAPAAHPLAYRETDWPAGCVASLGPGDAALGWRAPHGRVHVAGTESATAWPGYMEGAIEAGERAAREVLAGD